MHPLVFHPAAKGCQTTTPAQLSQTFLPSGKTRYSFGDPFLDRYLAFVAGRSRPNTLRAIALDLKAFFGAVEKNPEQVRAADIFGFLAHQRGDRSVIRLASQSRG